MIAPFWQQDLTRFFAPSTLPPDSAGAPVTPPTPAQRNEVADGINNSVFDGLFGTGAGSFGNSFASAERSTGPSGGGSAGGDMYSWANRLRDLPEEDALQELSAMGFTDPLGARRGENFDFASGTGSSRKKRNGQAAKPRALGASRRR